MIQTVHRSTIFEETFKGIPGPTIQNQCLRVFEFFFVRKELHESFKRGSPGHVAKEGFPTEINEKNYTTGENPMTVAEIVHEI